MLAKSICSPGPGYGIVQFVAQEAKGLHNGRAIVVLTSLPEMREQWRQYLPDAVYASVVREDHAKHLAGCLVILHTRNASTTLLQTLHELNAEVWLVESPLKQALIRIKV